MTSVGGLNDPREKPCQKVSMRVRTCAIACDLPPFRKAHSNSEVAYRHMSCALCLSASPGVNCTCLIPLRLAHIHTSPAVLTAHYSCYLSAPKFTDSIPPSTVRGHLYMPLRRRLNKNSDYLSDLTSCRRYICTVKNFRNFMAESPVIRLRHVP